MIEVAFIIREPGNHQEFMRTKLPVVPRVGETVALAGDEYGGRVVHSVEYVITDNEAEAHVLLMA